MTQRCPAMPVPQLERRRLAWAFVGARTRRGCPKKSQKLAGHHRWFGFLPRRGYVAKPRVGRAVCGLPWVRKR